MWSLAGELGGLDPWDGRFTLRQLDWMARGRSDAAWDHTAEILAMLFNANRGKSRPRSSEFYHPRSRNKKPVKPKAQLSASQHVAMLEAMLIK